VYRRRAFVWRDTAHPFLQQQLPASERSIVFRSPAAGALLAVVAGHVVRGRVLFPGAGYLEMACAAAGAAGAAALHNVYFLQPLAVEALGLVVECAVFDGRFEVRSEADDTVDGARVHCSGETRLERAPYRADAELALHRAGMRVSDVACLYDRFDVVGLQYGPRYRNLVQMWGGMAHALARLRHRPSTEGTLVHPADLDDALCASAVLVSSGTAETRLPFAVDDARILGGSGNLWAVCRPFPARTRLSSALLQPLR
jgi:acyl transferase domain-containing protein